MPELGHDGAAELAARGADVLHPGCLEPALRGGLMPMLEVDAEQVQRAARQLHAEFFEGG